MSIHVTLLLKPKHGRSRRRLHLGCLLRSAQDQCLHLSLRYGRPAVVGTDHHLHTGRGRPTDSGRDPGGDVGRGIPDGRRSLLGPAGLAEDVERGDAGVSAAATGTTICCCRRCIIRTRHRPFLLGTHTRHLEESLLRLRRLGINFVQWGSDLTTYEYDGDIGT